ncbi:hypothetical protein AURDEDRAFT_158707 [Auricularia subglabra TFB-10046 SS5]|nr:hypothetical protein AURDEDRAFT_158707 [Auricularia subglabra TFB-10046 SS5]
MATSNASSAASNAASATASAATGRKRAAPELTRGGKKKKVSNSSIWVFYGRIFGRIHNFLDPAGVIFDEGLEIAIDRAAAEEACEDFEVDASDRRIEVSFLALEKELRTKEPNALKDMDLAAKITAEIDEGVSMAKSDDTSSLKSAVVDWIEIGKDEPKLHRTDKTGRGFNHPATGRLLIPVGAVWTPTLQTQVQDGVMSFSGDEFPTFMYKDGKFDPENPWTGFCQHALAEKAFKHYFKSPSSADKENNESGTSRKGNAALHGFDAVTVGSICYVHAHLKHALSSSRVFSKTDPEKNGDLEGFYGTLYQILTHPDEKENLDALLAWWNKRVFPSARRTRERSAKSTINYFEAAREARMAEAQEEASS